MVHIAKDISFFDLPPEERARYKLAGRVRLAREYAKAKDVLAWGQVVMPETFSLPYCYEFHQYLIDIRHHEFSMTKGPRGHAKTSVGNTLVSMFQGLEEPEMFNHYLSVQGTQAKALNLNKTIMNEIESNDVILEIYGDMIGKSWTATQFELANHVAFTAVSTGTSIRGILYENRRPDYVMGDDLYNEEHINNPELTVKVNDWVKSTLYSARARSKRWAIKFTGTAINEYDMLTWLEKQALDETRQGLEPSVKCKTFKAIKDWDKQILLWPELYSVGGKDPWAAIMRDFKLMGSHIFMREMQNEPRDESTAIIKRSWLYKTDGSSWEYDPIELTQRINKDGSTIRIAAIRIGNDPSIGKKNESDYTGTAKVIETIDGEGSEFWIEWCDEAHLTLEGRKDQLVSTARECSPGRMVTEVRIEAIGGFDDYASYVIQQTNLPVHRVEWVVDKITNLENRSHYFENGKVHLSRLLPEEIKDKLIHQLTTNYPEHDDIRDAVLLTMDLESGAWEKFMR